MRAPADAAGLAALPGEKRPGESRCRNSVAAVRLSPAVRGGAEPLSAGRSRLNGGRRDQSLRVSGSSSFPLVAAAHESRARWNGNLVWKSEHVGIGSLSKQEAA